MIDILAGIIGTTCICSLAFILSQLCSQHNNVKSPQFVVIKKDHYDNLLKQPAAAEHVYILEQPLLPEYSEHATSVN